MSRIRVFTQDGKSRGEFVGQFSRGWAITGPADIRGGGSSSIELTQETAGQPWMQLGRLVLVEDETLPPWCGVIDPDWQAYGKPSVSVYNIEYLLSRRTITDVWTRRGPTSELVKWLLQAANKQESTVLRIGEMEHDAPHEETVERRTAWEQMVEIVQHAGMELTFRPEIVGTRLVVFMDLARSCGQRVPYLYHDGPNANMAVTSATISGEIWNLVVGTNDAASEDERLVTGAMTDDVSIRQFGLRSTVVQFQGITDQKTLEDQTRSYLDAYKRPRLRLTANIRDDGEAFRRARLGNASIWHAGDVRLPAGLHGFRGDGRILAMAYDEPSRTLGATVVAVL